MMNTLLKMMVAVPLATMLACSSCPRPAAVQAPEAASACVSSPLPIGLVRGRTGDEVQSAHFIRRPVCLAAAGTVTRA